MKNLLKKVNSRFANEVVIKKDDVILIIAEEKEIASKNEEYKKIEWIKVKMNNENDLKTFMSKYPNHIQRYIDLFIRIMTNYISEKDNLFAERDITFHLLINVKIRQKLLHKNSYLPQKKPY